MRTHASEAAQGHRRGRSVGIAAAGGFVRHIVLTLAVVAALFPLFFMISTALRTQNAFLADPLGLPIPPNLDNFRRAVGGDIARWVLNSFVVTLCSVVLASGAAAAAAYALVRLPFPGSTVLLRLVVSLMVIPTITLLIPIFLVMNTLGRINHFDAVIITYAGLMFPFSLFMLVRFFETVPEELFDAAEIDGASHVRILWHVVLPLMQPILLTIGVVNALWAWNELIFAVVLLQEESSRTLQAGLALLKGRDVSDASVLMAGACISTLPMLLLYMFGQRYFMRGLTGGAIKG